MRMKLLRLVQILLASLATLIAITSGYYSGAYNVRPNQSGYNLRPSYYPNRQLQQTRRLPYSPYRGRSLEGSSDSSSIMTYLSQYINQDVCMSRQQRCDRNNDNCCSGLKCKCFLWFGNCSCQNRMGF